jgi:gas vesicle protein
MEKRRASRFVQTAGTLALGAAVGSIAALLFAPASGRVTRQQIARRLRTLRRQTTRELGQRIRYAKTWVAEHVTNGNGRRVHHSSFHHA